MVSLEGIKGVTIEIPAFQMFHGGNSTFIKKDVILKLGEVHSVVATINR